MNHYPNLAYPTSKRLRAVSLVSSKKPVERKRGLSRWEKAGIPFIILIVAWVVYSVTQPSVSIQPQTTTSSTAISGGQQLGYKTISVSDASAMIQSSPNLLVVDVRTPQEYAQGHLKGATNIPLSDLPLRIGGLDPNRANTCILSDRIQKRSSQRHSGESRLHAGVQYGWRYDSMDQLGVPNCNNVRRKSCLFSPMA